jgi:hypothetical protein
MINEFRINPNWDDIPLPQGKFITDRISGISTNEYRSLAQLMQNGFLQHATRAAANIPSATSTNSSSGCVRARAHRSVTTQATAISS